MDCAGSVAMLSKIGLPRNEGDSNSLCLLQGLCIEERVAASRIVHQQLNAESL